ncbi:MULTISPECIES: aldehyde dehydrogenase family protein [Pseudonocardia]|uniref:3-succinoylsemialdehyde-pyridine dehydrogenase n=2 Tax=Pseudonocardia TaxID=1847 RepID=A0A1Y2N8B0_PSEAH|nr:MULTISPECIES: aldehyde dehydrogenase family protein [Pseudonocardia]OSY43683.1 3-succinoylsemialdehyde-pyridine dehydrogenase [Pseudonocardia autotrophica]TDN73327.1 aldehyde dehydrogenase (NAD+) [Pseudonocardia autotrophica]BBG04065.1 aldehyde dehydrogenase [Pseudonocardia autotrophica]GEC26202.1 aldehyde dehydrogenase [Pseudonocardia saturnea]
MSTLQHFIGGTGTPGGAERIDVTDPATGAVVGSVPAGTAQDVDRAVAAARAAFPGWASTPVPERAAVVQRISDGIRERAGEIAASITAEMGSPITFSQKVQVAMPVGSSAAFAALAADFAWTEEIGNSLVVREPVGVVGAITPWNYPLHQIVAKVAPALLAGNTVVLKPTEVAPLTAQILAEITVAAGLPDGAFNVVHGTGPVVGEAIAAHPGVDMVSFTGSTRAGKRVSVVASDTVKRVALELGGKSANVILDDADLGKAVKVGLGNAWINGGQTCTAWTRMLVPAARQEEILDQLVAAAERYTVGDPTDPSTRIGPMSSTAQQERVRSYVERGVADGARVVFGGPGSVEGLDGAYVRPTIFADVEPDAVVAQEEIFGPVLSVIPYADEEQAVEIANSTVYGLAGAVFGEQEHALAVARKLRTGQVDVNGGAFNILAPFGGYKQSGNGRELGRFGLEEFLETKSIQR